MVLEGFLEFEFDFFVLGDQLLLVGQDFTFQLFQLDHVDVNLEAKLLLSGNPLFFLLLTPLGKIILSLFVGLNENSILVQP